MSITATGSKNKSTQATITSSGLAVAKGLMACGEHMTRAPSRDHAGLLARPFSRSQTIHF